jgi:mRNA-degrading endonuclease RelE of RelBE toxin-antitoxin system
MRTESRLSRILKLPKAEERREIRIWFRETPGLTAALNEYFGGDEPLRLLQLLLARVPEAGSVIPGCGGARKLRWPDPRRSKGKRGGLRVIYLYVPAAENILLVDVYNKDEMEDLSPQDKKEIHALAEDYRREVLAETKRF